ncbi:hypothetical protein DYBT9275_00044 [Dyadobacter sp. CECT 9275]|uniref:Uncharacterized protein n=1 Tax=Dyadobacter helix TaxID=2822344 RepID=A0A916JAU4_9BACT|nr:hypothetical protein DYBT9275_00044 [Dyadobacter sp. CECT 9275]
MTLLHYSSTNVLRHRIYYNLAADAMLPVRRALDCTKKEDF